VIDTWEYFEIESGLLTGKKKKKKKTLSSVLQPFYRNSRSIAVRQEQEQEDNELDDELSTVTPFVFSRFGQSWWCFDFLSQNVKDFKRLNKTRVPKISITGR
jgi:hypothetical protein